MKFTRKLNCCEDKIYFFETGRQDFDHAHLGCKASVLPQDNAADIKWLRDTPFICINLYLKLISWKFSYRTMTKSTADNQTMFFVVLWTSF